ncbi:RidA family protein [Sphingopyxis sp. Q841]|uniref:RidA family protein n=1 Tax=Sphingopyxis sp. Q841 TaxID=3458250 RepID=UPI0040369915
MRLRRSIEIEGFRHGDQPIPAASLVGPLLMTGGVFGVDRARGVIPDEASEQARLMFDNLVSIMEAAGGSAESIAKITVYVKDAAVREVINPVWRHVFPDAKSRPARHTIVNERLPGNMLVQCDATAWIELA